MNLVASTDIPLGQPVDVRDLKGVRTLHNTLVNTIRKHKAVGLAAVQLGIPSNCCVIKHQEVAMCLVNASYKGIGKTGINKEGCLSLPDQDWLVPRYDDVWVKGYIFVPEKNAVMKVETYFQNKVVRFEGLVADIIQHEIDHQNGILISHIGEKV